MRTITVGVFMLMSSCLLSVGVRADDERLKNAEAVLKAMTETPDNGIPLGLLRKAKCIVVVPSVKKAALGFGGQYGRGYLSCRTDGRGWSAPGAVRIEGGSWGLQIGGSGTDVIMLVSAGKGAERLISNQFKLGADAAVAAGPVGRQAAAETDPTFTAEILTWSRSKGLFAGISLQGSTLREDSSENKDLYGRDISNKEITDGKVTAPKAAEGFMALLTKY
jgi:SH3 domain-containing YSC84-like protein 1